jgi:hypothetical protein
MEIVKMVSAKSLKLLEQLEKHPNLLARVEQLLQIVDGADEEHYIQLSDDAEDAVADNLRNFGKELLTEWGQGQESRACKNFKQVDSKLKSHSKKNSAGTPPTEK